MRLENKKIAILATDGFEESELFTPLKALKGEGATVYIISDKKGEIKGWDRTMWGETITVDKKLNEVDQKDYCALVLPGGVMNPDKLRINEDALNFIKSFFENGKPVAAICHAPWLLINAKVIKGRNVTSYKSIKEDLVNAGATWIDKEVVVDNGLVTSRNPHDLPAFCDKIIEEILEGKHAHQHA